MIVIVAPYTSSGEGENLGAARKIAVVIRALASAGAKVVLVNSAHQGELTACVERRERAIEGVVFTEISPRRWSSRPIGKFLNLFDASRIWAEVRREGRIELVWLYNGYAFECMFGIFAARAGAKVFLEFEDWHFARWRLSVKPLVDYLCWRVLLKYISAASAVSAQLAGRLERAGIATQLLPGLIDDKVMGEVASREPFPSGSIVRIGYMGGLTAEKGGELILHLVSALPEGYEIVVTGGGDLAEAFRLAALAMPSRLRFLGVVPTDVLVQTMATCDVFLNPHAPIDDGSVFPFKVVEYISTGRPLVSTPLPMGQMSHLKGGIIFADRNVSAFLDAIQGAKGFYKRNRDGVIECGMRARSLYGPAAIQGMARALLD